MAMAPCTCCDNRATWFDAHLGPNGEYDALARSGQLSERDVDHEASKIDACWGPDERQAFADGTQRPARVELTIRPGSGHHGTRYLIAEVQEVDG